MSAQFFMWFFNERFDKALSFSWSKLIAKRVVLTQHSRPADSLMP